MSRTTEQREISMLLATGAAALDTAAARLHSLNLTLEAEELSSHARRAYGCLLRSAPGLSAGCGSSAASATQCRATCSTRSRPRGPQPPLGL